VETNIWSKKALAEESWRRWVVGELGLFFDKKGAEWIIGSYRYPRAQERLRIHQKCSSFSEEDIYEEIEWHRYMIGQEAEIEIVPALPDRPLVVRPNVRRRILPGREAQVHFYVPVWIQLFSHSVNRRVMLEEHPSLRLSSTWFGDMQTGELCYTLETVLSQEFERSSPPAPYYAECVLNINNISSSLLDFYRIAVHVEYLNLYLDGDGLHTNEVNVNFSGIDQISQVKYSTRGPKWLKNPVKIASAREVPSKNILKRSFSYIKHLTEM